MRPLLALALLCASLPSLATAASRPASPRPSLAASWYAAGPQDSSMFGSAMCAAGDVNGDGFDDVLVAARFEDHPETDEGRAYLYLGGPAGLAATPSWTAESDQPGARFGESAAGAGDVNGDGYDDVVIGAVLYDTTQNDAGKAFLYLGGPGGLAAAPAWTWSTNQGSSYTGNAVAGAGDVNGDGYADVLVAAHYWDDPAVNEGGAFLFLGGPAGLGATPAWTGHGGQAFADYAFSVAGAGDVNGDGYGDAIVGAIGYDLAVPDQGRVFVYLGGPSGLAAAPAWTADGQSAATVEAPHYGCSVAGAGDVNGDGFGDVLVGYEHFVANSVSEGRAELYLGGAAGPAAAPAWIQLGVVSGAHVGHAVSGAGDVNRDGYADFLVGAWQDTDGGEWGEGRAYLFLGGAAGPAPTAAWTAAGDVAYAGFGGHVGGAGDVNGDGWPDWLASAYGFDNGVRPRGFATVFEGPQVVAVREPAPAAPRRAGLVARPGGVLLCVLPAAGRACVTLADVRGRRIATLADGLLPAGPTRLAWDGRAADGRSAAAGVYLARLDAGASGVAEAMVLRLP